ncbi:2-alkenal reductase [Acuticoccus sediminis]|uniref:2-alkenal reductase n=1 Tax=Acuticoccus sediminis TaxID=2184697 RepID=A0A8B2NLX7_9HYPH|nr:trypsin-like peptidase domain-containing protein [Acuticoccus sediminis]RAI00676.1 2-alkenal reductase [Acuticoccus sediminis]
MQNDPFNRRLLVIAACAAVVILAWHLGPALRVALLQSSVEPRVVSPRGALSDAETSTIEAFEGSRDSVVSISTSRRVVDYWSRNAYDVPRGTGSGFIWDKAGHVVTNNHVIQGASSATVRLADGRVFDAHLVGADPTHDIAVLRIDVRDADLPVLPIGTSGDLKVGQSVLAIGNPFGLDWTLTTGIISALDRELPNDSGGLIRGLIQTDAAINPGNSGGPLIDSAGRLIGMNTAIYSPSGSNAGIGFSVPVDTVNRVVPQILSSGRYRPPVLGVSSDPRADEILARQGVKGVLVLGVDAGTPAADAGLVPARLTPDGAVVPGDVIVALDDEPLDDTTDLRAALDRRRAGDKVQLTVLRNRARVKVEIPLQAAR